MAEDVSNAATPIAAKIAFGFALMSTSQCSGSPPVRNKPRWMAKVKRPVTPALFLRPIRQVAARLTDLNGGTRARFLQAFKGIGLRQPSAGRRQLSNLILRSLNRTSIVNP